MCFKSNTESNTQQYASYTKILITAKEMCFWLRNLKHMGFTVIATTEKNLVSIRPLNDPQSGFRFRPPSKVR